MMSLFDALVAEYDAKRVLHERINQGVLPGEPKVPVLRLVRDYGKAVERRKAVEIADAVIERVPR